MSSGEEFGRLGVWSLAPQLAFRETLKQASFAVIQQSLNHPMLTMELQTPKSSTLSGYVHGGSWLVAYRKVHVLSEVGNLSPMQECHSVVLTFH